MKYTLKKDHHWRDAAGLWWEYNYNLNRKVKAPWKVEILVLAQGALRV